MAGANDVNSGGVNPKASPFRTTGSPRLEHRKITVPVLEQPSVLHWGLRIQCEVGYRQDGRPAIGPVVACSKAQFRTVVSITRHRGGFGA